MSLKRYLEKSAGEQVDFDSLNVPDLESLPSGNRWWGTPLAVIGSALFPFAGRGLGRWARGGAYNLGRKLGYNPVAKWQMNRGNFSPSAANRELSRATTYSNSQKGWFGNTALGKLKDKLFRDPYLRGRYGAPKLFGKKVDNLSRLILPKKPGWQAFHSALLGTGTYQGMHFNSQDLLSAQAALTKDQLSQQNNNNNAELIGNAAEISNRLQMPGIIGGAAGAGLGGMLGSSMASSSRKEKIENIARVKGISEEEAAKFVEEDNHSSWLGAGLGGVGGYLLANKMYPSNPEAVLETNAQV